MGDDGEGLVSGEFRREEDGIVATLAPLEAALLRQFVSELRMLLEAEVGAGSGDDEPDTGATSPGGAEAELFAAISELDQDGPVVVPDDPVLARLLPDAYPADPEAAGDFRRFTQDRLVARKYAASGAVLDALPADPDGPVLVVLDEDDVQVWLGALNDVRLALASRLGVEQDDDARWDSLPEDDPRGAVHEVYQWLGWVQESLLRTVWD